MDFFASVWDLFMLMFWAFVFVSAIIAVFMVIADLFRDHEMNGFVKALWIIFLIGIPVLTTLVYLIFRGRGMAQRSARDQIAAQQAAEDYIRQVAGQSSTDEITRAKALLDSGAISQAEFENLKSQALARA